MRENNAFSHLGWICQRFGKRKNYAVAETTRAVVCLSPSLLPSLRTSFCFTCKYDVCVCYSDKKFSQALALVSFLGSPSRGLCCYLQPCDCPLSGAVPIELCRAVQNSHCWVLLITPNFLKDDWCLYQMQQMPRELGCFFSVDLNRNREAGYTQVYKTVLQYLKEMCRKEEFHMPPSCSHTEGNMNTNSKVHYSETAKNSSLH
uniref:Toll-interleukin 1 receptor (TIR) domain containing adaptor protein n=1 Tax=Electrophorus electricus TaxID=8005 RepID=A0A4W4H5M6_ELEEL